MSIIRAKTKLVRRIKIKWICQSYGSTKYNVIKTISKSEISLASWKWPLLWRSVEIKKVLRGEEKFISKHKSERRRDILGNWRWKLSLCVQKLTIIPFGTWCYKKTSRAWSYNIIKNRTILRKVSYVWWNLSLIKWVVKQVKKVIWTLRKATRQKGKTWKKISLKFIGFVAKRRLDKSKFIWRSKH